MLKNLFYSRLIREKLKFLIVGFANLLMSYVIYILLLESKLNYNLAFFISWVFGLFFSYYFNYYFVFNVKKNNHQISSILIFFIMSLAQLIFTLYLLNILIESYNMNEKIVPIIAIIIFFILRFLLSKFIIFK